MRYTYAYKTSDGTRHEAAMEAESREAVFLELRKRGIKAIKVVAADGSKANGEIRGIRKRDVAVLVAVAALLAGVAAYVGGTRLVAPSRGPGAAAFETSRTRRQVIGDAAVIEKGIRTGWADVFKGEGDRFLASFAIPGVKAGLRHTSAAALEEALRSGSTSRPPDASAPLEARQIISMVEGMKEEARRYVAAGGSLLEYGRRLTERQDEEIAVYERAKAEIERAKSELAGDEFLTLLEKRNDQLRNLGIRPITLE